MATATKTKPKKVKPVEIELSTELTQPNLTRKATAFRERADLAKRLGPTPKVLNLDRATVLALSDLRRKLLTAADGYELVRRVQKETDLPLIARNRETRAFTQNTEEYQIPLVWNAVFPRQAPTVKVSILPKEGSTSYWKRLDLTTPVPALPQEARDAAAKYKDVFSDYEVWWVPKDENIVGEFISKDPVLVGVVKVTEKEQYCFELYRWIDDGIEDPFYNAAGY